MATIDKPGRSGSLADELSRSSDAVSSEEKRQRRRDNQSLKEYDKQLKDLLKKKFITEKEYAKALSAYSAKLASENVEKERKLRREMLEDQAKYAEKFGDRLSASLQLAVENTTKAAYAKAEQSVTQMADLLTKYQSAVNARIQGSNNTFQKMYDMVRKNVGSSPYVSQTKVLENLGSLVEKGIAYNVEQRAFLQTVKEDIATTFDAANGTLLQLIRIQQADSTAARLGMEAALTRFLNAEFRDTSYLSTSFDTVSAALLGVSSLKNQKEAAELEFVAQKWLGALASVGVNESTLSSLAKGINALGTGDISSLAGNQALQSLLVMASGRAGVSYGSTLTGGLTASDLNRILRSIVEYGQTIAQSTSNVVKSSYASLFGLSISDLAAISNLDAETLRSISGTALSYSGMLKETSYQLGQVGSRQHLSEKIKNVFDNTIANIGGGIANNAVMYTTWMINDLVEKATGGINIPFVSALGTGVDLNANVNQLVKIGLIGTSLMTSIPSIIGGLMGKTMDLSSWGGADYTPRGGTTITTRGFGQGTSESGFAGNASYSDLYEQTVTSAKDKASEETKGADEDQTKIVPEIRDNTAKMVAYEKAMSENVSEIKDLLKTVISGGRLMVGKAIGEPW